VKKYQFKDYDEYLETQRETNIRKARYMGTGASWVTKQELLVIAEHIHQSVLGTINGICHGVRTGNEVRVLHAFLGSDVIGTDLEVHEFKNVVKWDFNEPNPDWWDTFGFVYSNAFDHCYDPKSTLTTWWEQLHIGGLMYIHWSAEHSKVNRANCVGGNREDFINLVDSCGLKVNSVLNSEHIRPIYVIGR